MGSCEADEFDHSLDAMVRTPGWTRTDPDSAAAWRAFQGARMRGPRTWLRRARAFLARGLK